MFDSKTNSYVPLEIGSSLHSCYRMMHVQSLSVGVVLDDLVISAV